MSLDNTKIGFLPHFSKMSSSVNKLLAPIDSLLTRRVVFIADDILGYIPFEALLTQKPVYPYRYYTHSYFFLEHDVSYCYSTELLQILMNRPRWNPIQNNLLAVAPFFDGDTSLLVQRNIDITDPTNRLPALKYAAEEALQVSKIMDGQTIIGKEATEATFSQIAKGYRILHIASHAKANEKLGDLSFCAFAEIEDSLENEWLRVREIYNLELDADMVVLSACETGIGEYLLGEGMINLARAFIYAGARSVVTSLWAVDDEATKDLMVAFYENLALGLPKDEALVLAKRTYLNDKDNRLKASPYYWAGFIAIGDMGVVRK